MTNITDYLFKKADGLITRQPEVRDEGKGYEMADTGGVELEVGEFLYGITRLIKPLKVLTTGIFTGISDMYIAQALKENNYGFSIALEIEEQHIKRAKELWKKTEVIERITPILMKSLDYQPEAQYQLMFLDSEMHLRLHELVKYYPHLSEGGYVFLHDFPPNLCFGNVNPDHPNYVNWPVGEFPQEFNQLLKEDKLRMMTFPNPRGMIGFYKPRKDEYEV